MNLPIRLSLLLAVLTFAITSQGADPEKPENPIGKITIQSEQDFDQDLTKKIDEIIKEARTIQPGAKRKDLATHFTTEGGLSTPRKKTFVSKRCPYIKIDVLFEPKASRDESPEDTITAVSKPYLQFAVID